MAIKIYEKFSPRANPADGDYPYGSIKNESVPGAKDGTPLDAVWANDYAGFDADLFAQTGTVPSGAPDKLGASQRAQAIKKLSGIQCESISDMKSRPLKSGDVVSLLGYNTKDDGSHHFRKIDLVDDGSGEQLANGLWANLSHEGEVLFSWFGNIDISKAIEYCRAQNAIFKSNDSIVIADTVVQFERGEVGQNYPNFHTVDYFFNGEVQLINSTFLLKTVKSSYYFSKLTGNGFGSAISMDECQGSNSIKVGEISGFSKGIHLKKAYSHSVDVGLIVNCDKGIHLEDSNSIVISHGRVGGNFTYGDVDLDPYSCDIGIHIDGGSGNSINGVNVEYCKKTINSIGILDEGAGTQINDMYIESCKDSLLVSNGRGCTYNLAATETNMQTNKSILLNGTDCTLNISSYAAKRDAAISDTTTTPTFQFPADCYLDTGVNNTVTTTYLKRIPEPFGLNLIPDNFNLESKSTFTTGTASGSSWATSLKDGTRFFKRQLLQSATKATSADDFYGITLGDGLLLNNINTYTAGIGIKVTKGSYKVMLKVQDVKIQSLTQILNVDSDRMLSFSFKKLDFSFNSILQLLIQPLTDDSEIELFAPFVTIDSMAELMPYQTAKENFYNNNRPLFRVPVGVTQANYMDYENIIFDGSAGNKELILIPAKYVNLYKVFHVVVTNYTPTQVNRFTAAAGSVINSLGFLDIKSSGILYPSGNEWVFEGDYIVV